MKEERKSKYMYGKLYHELFELRSSINTLFHNYLDGHDLSMEDNNAIVDLRNEVQAIIQSWVGAKKMESKFGIKLPLDKTGASIESFMAKQSMSYNREYVSCEICGEDRISNWCHILPRSEGGADNKDNYLFLCPTHHHLFDHHRLSKEEWSKLDFSKKGEPAQIYIREIKEKLQRGFWNEEN